MTNKITTVKHTKHTYAKTSAKQTTQKVTIHKAAMQTCRLKQRTQQVFSNTHISGFLVKESHPFALLTVWDILSRPLLAAAHLIGIIVCPASFAAVHIVGPFGM